MTDIVERLRGWNRAIDRRYLSADITTMTQEAADEIEQLREQHAVFVEEIERLRHPKVIVGSRELWEAMGKEIEMDEATLAAITAYDNCTRLPEDVMGYGPMRAALTAALPHLQTAAMKEKAGD